MSFPTRASECELAKKDAASGYMMADLENDLCITATRQKAKLDTNTLTNIYTYVSTISRYKSSF